MSIYRPPFALEEGCAADFFADRDCFLAFGCLNVTFTRLCADAPALGANVTFTVTLSDFFLASDRFAAELRVIFSGYVADFVADRVTLPIDDPDTVIRPAAGTLTFSFADTPVTALSFETLTGEGAASSTLPCPRNVIEPTAGHTGGVPRAP